MGGQAHHGLTMTAIIYDTDAIGKIARLKALDGTPQNVVQPMTVNTASVEFDPYGMYAFGLPPSAGTPETDCDPLNPNVDTAPSEYSPPDFDPA